jgi:Na+/H+-dicarboxylate symporter
MHWLQYFLLTLPLAVFVLIFPLATKTGFTLVGVAGLNIVALSVLLLVFLVLIYLMVGFWGNITVGKFAKAMVQPQIVAASTRSSLATIPALMETAEFKMGIPKTVTAVIVPFFISVFRMNRAISSPFHYLFLSYVYGLPLNFGMLLIFLGLQVVISFGSPGIPSGGKMTNLPLYLAAGIPLEGYILLKAVDAIPDIFKTLLNVTQVMVVSSIVAKKQNWK